MLKNYKVIIERMHAGSGVKVLKSCRRFALNTNVLVLPEEVFGIRVIYLGIIIILNNPTSKERIGEFREIEASVHKEAFEGEEEVTR
jgi:hypothetical protein